MSDDVKNQQKINALLAEEKLLNEQIQQQAADGNSQSEPDLNTEPSDVSEKVFQRV